MKEQLKALLQAIENAESADVSQQVKAFGAVVDELSTALADVVEALESGKHTDRIVQAIKDIQVRIDGGVTMSPTNNVEPTPVTVQNEVNVSPTPVTLEAIVQVPPAPAPVVHVVERDTAVGAKWEVRIPGGPGRVERFMTITRVN